jgi:hypothetical protein
VQVSNPWNKAKAQRGQAATKAEANHGRHGVHGEDKGHPQITQISQMAAAQPQKQKAAAGRRRLTQSRKGRRKGAEDGRFSLRLGLFLCGFALNSSVFQGSEEPQNIE